MSLSAAYFTPLADDENRIACPGWEAFPAAAGRGLSLGLSPALRPCPHHLRFLLCTSPPCHCGASHLSPQQLKEQLTELLLLQHGERVVGWQGEWGSAAAAGAGAEGGGGQLFMTGLPRGCRGSVQMEQQLKERFRAWGECRGETSGERGVGRGGGGV